MVFYKCPNNFPVSLIRIEVCSFRLISGLAWTILASGWRYLWLLLVGRCLCQIFARVGNKESEGARTGPSKRNRWPARVGNRWPATEADVGDETAVMWSEATDRGAEATDVPRKSVCTEQCSYSICMCGCCNWLSSRHAVQVKTVCWMLLA